MELDAQKIVNELSNTYSQQLAQSNVRIATLTAQIDMLNKQLEQLQQLENKSED